MLSNNVKIKYLNEQIKLKILWNLNNIFIIFYYLYIQSYFTINNLIQFPKFFFITFKQIDFNYVSNYKNNKIIFYHFYKTALHFAIEEKNIKMVKILLSSEKIDVNYISIYVRYFNTI